MKNRYIAESYTVNKIQFSSIQEGLCKDGSLTINKTVQDKDTTTQKLHKRMSLGQPIYQQETIKLVKEYKLKSQKNSQKKTENAMEANRSPTSGDGKITEGKIPFIPITLMNSTMKNKKMQIQLLVKQQQSVQEYLKRQKDSGVQFKTQISFSGARFEQEQAVRDLLNRFGDQLNLRSVKEQRSRKQAQNIKEQYTRDLFIKNQSPNTQQGINNRQRKFLKSSQKSVPMVDTNSNFFFIPSTQILDLSRLRQSHANTPQTVKPQFTNTQSTFSQRNFENSPRNLRQQRLPKCFQNKLFWGLNNPDSQRRTYCQHIQNIQTKKMQLESIHLLQINDELNYSKHDQI